MFNLNSRDPVRAAKVRCSPSTGSDLRIIAGRMYRAAGHGEAPSSRCPARGPAFLQNAPTASFPRYSPRPSSHKQYCSYGSPKARSEAETTLYSSLPCLSTPREENGRRY
ncbi:hypothetical protein H6P81_009307 [Aristolochia fimbriata]|uniref:Uncharacterized protein n=1 Tax=Aristolochia fimbriata TaxID=158543 RepID=A0AAV7ENM4_ARIFI|nr:hypothetical protein H6P81_009307 [Aristolochia fimbriata]